MEEDSVVKCLQGASVIEPLASEQIKDGAQVEYAVQIESSKNAMSPSDPVDHDTSSIMQVSTPASFLCAAIDFPSPESSQEVFAKLVAVAPLNSDPLESDFSSILGSPITERTSGLAGQDRLSELMLNELTLLNLDPNV